MKKIQSIILRHLWKEKTEVNLDDLVIISGYKRLQCRRAIDRLKQRDLIKKRKVRFIEAGYKIPPRDKILVRVNEKREWKIKKVIEG